VSVPDVGQVLTVAVTVRKSGTCFALAALHGAFDGVHFVHVLAHAYVHAKWQRALLHTVAYDASCVAFFEAYFVRHDVNIRPFAF
jgi:hypothetical protein